jgi:CRISPR-associated protein (TIGR02584 family)
MHEYRSRHASGFHSYGRGTQTGTVLITETVYGLLGESRAATDVYVLTTSTGRRIIEDQLLGRGGQWSRLQREYPGARAFHLSRHNLIVLKDARGALLAGVRSSADNAAAADQIMRYVAEHTGDGRPPLHASIAGGRKTMGYLLAAAMMLYGRPQDRLVPFDFILLTGMT